MGGGGIMANTDNNIVIKIEKLLLTTLSTSLFN